MSSDRAPPRPGSPRFTPPGRTQDPGPPERHTPPDPLEGPEERPTTDLRNYLPAVAMDVALDRLADKVHELHQDLERHAPPAETPRERVRRRILALLERAEERDRAGDPDRAVLALELAFTENPDSALAHKLLSLHESAIERVLESYLGDLHGVPHVAVDGERLLSESIDAHAAFLLSRVDGVLTFHELLDIAGMPRIQALRYAAALLLRGILMVSHP